MSIENKRWGLGATLGFSLIICALYAFAQAAAMGVAAGIRLTKNPNVDKEILIESIFKNGLYVSLGVILSAWVGSLVIGAIILLRDDISLKEYLAIKNIPLKDSLPWLAIIPVVIFCGERMGVILEQPGSDWMVQIYASAKYLPLLWIAFLIAAPLVEELFFRGFLFEGLRDSWMGSTGAVLVTSVAWAAIHVQYEMFQIVMIGVLGVMLGIAKIKTRSLYMTFGMHSFLNLIAIIEVANFVNS